MENQLENLRAALEKMEIVTVSIACQQFDLSREAVISFVQSDRHLRIFDDEKKHWINENVDGHC